MKPTKLSKGAYFDDDELLHDKAGNLMPDGVYDMEGVGIAAYAGNHETESKNMIELLEQLADS